ncbi:Transposase IS4 [Popillia japonica]|uniref:Transposase IS4 n=1 Tax=Popillia japonica TaxID=7064 RepID=A0AAW1MI09_POPJA
MNICTYLSIQSLYWERGRTYIKLIEELFDKGRTLYVDNCYKSVALAKTMIQRKTHLVGTIYANRRNNPANVINTKLRKGDLIALQSENKTVVLEWKDKSDVFMLSTKFDMSTTTY